MALGAEPRDVAEPPLVQDRAAGDAVADQLDDVHAVRVVARDPAGNLVGGVSDASRPFASPDLLAQTVGNGYTDKSLG